MPTFRAELRMHLPALARYARALTGEHSSSENLLQDCCARALAAEAQWRGGSAKAWLFTIMTNLNRSRLRSRAAAPGTAGAEALDAAEAPFLDPALRLGVDRALGLLSTEQREVLLLVALEGLSYAEAATALGVPLGTVMSRLSRARAAFRAALDGRADAALLRRVK